MDEDGVVTDARRLPVWSVVTRGYGYVWELRRHLAIPMAIVFAASLINSAVAYWLNPWLNVGAPGAGARLAVHGFRFAMLSVSIAFMVGVHRTVLLNEFRPGFGFLRWDRHMVRYLVMQLKLALTMMPVAIVAICAIVFFMMSSNRQDPAQMSPLLFVIVFVLAAIFVFLFARLGLALPAVALDDQKCLARSCSGPLWWSARLTEIPPRPESMNEWVVAMSLYGAIVTAVSTAVSTVALSLCYDVLVRGGGPAGHAA